MVEGLPFIFTTFVDLRGPRLLSVVGKQRSRLVSRKESWNEEHDPPKASTDMGGNYQGLIAITHGHLGFVPR